jgi:hypothetical protein
MEHRAIALVTSLLLAFAGLSVPPSLQAQATVPALGPALRAVQLQSLSQDRVRRWAAATPMVRCAPAPLTERPTASAEFARPSVAPLEDAFLDAAIVKHTFAGRNGHIPRSN